MPGLLLRRILKSRLGRALIRGCLVLALIGGLVWAWQMERQAFGDRRFAEGEAARQEAVNEATRKLNARITTLEAETETLAEELDREHAAALALEKRLAEDARADPGASDPGLGSASRMRIEAIR